MLFLLEHARALMTVKSVWKVRVLTHALIQPEMAGVQVALIASTEVALLLVPGMQTATASVTAMNSRPVQ